MSRKVIDIIEAVERFAPPIYAFPDDPIGLCLGRQENVVKGVLTALDLTPRVVEKALQIKADMIVTHHPPIYTPIKTITDDTPEGELLLTLMEERVALFSAHTNADACVGGLSDLMADLIFAKTDSRTPLITLAPHENEPPAGFGRVLFLPPLKAKTIADRVKKNLSAPFARLIGDPEKDVSSVCLWSGAIDEQVVDILSARAVDLLVCGESKHHLNIGMAARGIVAIIAGHDSTENPFAEKVRAVIETAYPEIEVEAYVD